MAKHLLSSAALLAVTVLLAACGGTTEARSRLDSENGAGDAGPDGAASGGGPCGSNEAAKGAIQLASAAHPSAIAVAGGNVFWIDSALGTVNEVSACGGAPTTLVTTSTLGSPTLIPAGLAVDGSNVYFTTQDPWNPDGNDGAVWSVPAIGGAPTMPTPTMLVHGLDRPGPIAASGARLYWIDSWQTDGDDGEIEQASLDGSSRTILASAQNGPWALSVGGGKVVWTTSGFVDSVRGTIEEAPVGGGIVDGLGVAQSMPVSVAVEGAGVFWVDQGDPNVSNRGSVVKQPLDPALAGDPIVLASGGAPQGIAVDGANVYWTDSQSQSVNAVPLAGGAPTSVATGQVAPLAIAVDGTSVYWTTLAEGTGQGAVRKIAK